MQRFFTGIGKTLCGYTGVAGKLVYISADRYFLEHPRRDIEPVYKPVYFTYGRYYFVVEFGFKKSVLKGLFLTLELPVYMLQYGLVDSF